eukprot:g4906.t1
MGKKTKTKPAAASADPVDEELATEVAELKRSGNNQFAERDYEKALETYDKAIKKLPELSTEKADIQSNKAACYLQMKRHKDAIRECSAALTSSPGFSKALIRRSKAYEIQGLYKKALTDIQQLNRSEASTNETKEVEKRLKDVIAGRRPPPARMPPMLYFSAKCTYESEVRSVHLTHSSSYAELLEAVKTKFPMLEHFLIKFQDQEGKMITVSERADVTNAISEVLAAYEKDLSSHGPRLTPQLQAIKFQIVKVESEEEVPKPPEEEVTERKILLAQKQAAAAEKTRVARQAERSGEGTGEDAVYEIDDWLVDFANLFRERTGIDPDRHVDMHNLGVEKCQKALDSSISTPEALPVFDEASEKFKEVTCVGLLNWGNVYLCIGHKIGSEAASQDKSASEVETQIMEYFEKAEERYNEAMKYKEDFYDGVLALAQLEFERAKIKIGLIVAPPEDSEKNKSEASSSQPPSKVPLVDNKPASSKAPVDDEKGQQAAAQAMNQAMKKALLKVDGSKLPSVQDLIDKSWSLYEKSVQLGIELDAQREKEKKPMKEKPKTSDAQDEPGLKTHALVMWGNIIFEQSQILAATEGDWKSSLDEAIGKFREAGCNEKDINQALRTHFKAAELDIPDPFEEPPVKSTVSDSAGSSQVEKRPPVKGLPSLPQKPKKSVEA